MNILCLSNSCRLCGMRKRIQIGVGCLRMKIGHLDERGYILAITDQLQDVVPVGDRICLLGPVCIVVVQNLVDLLPVVAEHVLNVRPQNLGLSGAAETIPGLLRLEVRVSLVFRDAEHDRNLGEHGLFLL